MIIWEDFLRIVVLSGFYRFKTGNNPVFKRNRIIITRNHLCSYELSAPKFTGIHAIANFNPVKALL
jgi:hypothetical protein